MVPERIEILFLIDYFHRTGGTEKHLVQLITGLPAERFRSTVVVFDAGENTLLQEPRRSVPIIIAGGTSTYRTHATGVAARG